MQIWFLLLVLICLLWWHWVSPEGNIYIESSLSLFLSNFILLPEFLYSTEQLAPFLHASQASSGKHSHSSLTWEINKIINYTTSWSKPKSTLQSSSCWPKISFLWNSCCHSFLPWATWTNCLHTPCLSSFHSSMSVVQSHHHLFISSSLPPSGGDYAGVDFQLYQSCAQTPQGDQEITWKTVFSLSSQDMQHNICNKYKGKEKSFIYISFLKKIFKNISSFQKSRILYEQWISLWRFYGLFNLFKFHMQLSNKLPLLSSLRLSSWSVEQIHLWNCFLFYSFLSKAHMKKNRQAF